MPGGKQVGVVEWFDDQKGFGFVIPDDGSQKVFVHFKEIVSNTGDFITLKAGDKVISTPK